MRHYLICGCLLALLNATAAVSGGADVVSAEAFKESAGSYRFNVTVRHADEGWNHYANEWQVVGADGSVYGTRTLYHPHVEEQPFTRSLSRVRIPEGVQQVTIRAGDSVHGYSGQSITIELP